jgi:quercetin dioxygenase-like cupin family protein
VELLPKQPTVKAPSQTFTGDAWFDVIARGAEPSRIRVNVVRFAPGARNAWYSHARGQTLHVTEGTAVRRPDSVCRTRPLSQTAASQARSATT